MGAIRQTITNESEEKQYQSILVTYQDNPNKFLSTDSDNAYRNNPAFSDDVIDRIIEIRDKAKEAGKTGEEALKDVEIELENVRAKGTKLGATFKNIGVSILNGLASAAISAAISGIIYLIDHAVNRVKYAEQAANKAKGKIDDVTESLNKSKSSVKDLGNRYAKLAQQVRFLGSVEQSQGTLSDDEYQEFLDISNQLAEVFPTLTKGYTDNGDAILDLSGDVNTIVGSLTELVAVQERIANKTILDNMGDVWTDYALKVEDANRRIKESEENHEAFKKEWDLVNDSIENGTSISTNGTMIYDRLFDNLGIDLSKIQTTESSGVLTYDLSQLEDYEKEQIKQLYREIELEYQTDTQGLKDTITVQNKEINSYISQAVKSINWGNNIESNEQLTKLMDGFVANYDFTPLLEQYGEDWEKVYQQFLITIQNSFGNLEVGDVLKIQSLYDKIFKINLSDGVYSQNVAVIKQYVGQIAALLGDEISEQDILNALGLGGIDYQVDTLRSRLGYTNNPNNQAEAQKNREIDDFINTLSDEDYDIIASLDIDKYKTLEELKAAIEEAQKYADEHKIEVKTKASESVSSIDSMRDAFGDDLISLYETTVTKAEKANGSDIEAVNSAFGGTTFNEEDFEKVNAMSNAIDQYNESLLESAGDATVAQKSLNKLANAYVDQNGVLNKLIDDGENATEAEKQYYIEQLKATGITNARSVVESRLSKQYKASATALTNLSKKIAQNRKALDKGVEAGDEYDKAITNIKDNVGKLLATYDENGNVTFTPEVDESFITKHLEDIYAATEGDIDALKRLREEAARFNMQKFFITIDLPSDVVQTKMNTIMDLVSQANNMDIEVGATIDDSSFVKTLESVLKTTDMTVDDINKAFEEIGFEASYEETGTSEVEVPYINSAYDYQTGRTKKVKVSNFALTVKKKSDYTGASVSYDGSTATTGSDSDSSGSDSDSNSNEDFSNSFDWIETAINRVEESISRLDEQVNNTYTTWTKRNNNLAKEIDEVTKEIELQSDASKRYQELSEEVWIPETYKIKVQNGELDVEDIDASMVTDEIRTYFDNMLASGEGDSEMIEKYTEGTLIDGDYASMLSDAISEYQDLFDKSVEASDQVASLTIEKQGLYTQAFDNIQSMYEDLGGTIDKQVDLIEEHVTRAEEMGYFASERYYNQLLDLERTNNTNLSTELDDLVAKMNEAVAQGEIEKGSEAWYDMYDSVMDVNQQLEESATNVAKLQNELRQLSWDKFDWIEEQLADINAEAEFALGLLENEENYGDDGRFTNSGYARLSLIGAQYYDATERVERYRKELAELDKQLAEDPNDTNLIERRTEAMEGMRDAISDSSQYVEDYRSVVKEAAEEQLSYLQDIIDKYKESLSSAKDLYDWEKNVRDQTDNIVDIQQQLTAYQNDDSEEARKRRQELQKQLDDAQQNLEESQWDRYISETGDMLDDMYSKYEEYLNTKIDEMGIEELMAIVNDGIGSAENGLNAIQEKYDYQLQYFNEFTNGKTVADIIDSINGVKDAYTSVTDAENNGTAQKVDGTTLEISVNEDGTISVSQVGGGKNLGSIKSTSGSWKQNDTGWWYEHDDGSYTTGGKETIDGKDYYFNDEGYMASNEYINGYHVAPDGEIESSGNEWHNENGQWWYGKDDEYATGHVFIDGDWHTFDENGWWVGQFAKGSKHINKTGIGLTQEEGTELIFRTSDGAMLTPLGQGDMVFTNEMSRRLWEIAKGDIPNGINIALPNMTNANSRDFNTTNNISIELPNVQNYEDFKREMKQDTELESFWQEITIGRMMGNNSLKKNRY